MLVAALFALFVVLAPAALAYPDPPPNPPVDPNAGVVVRGVSVTNAPSSASASSGLALTGGDVVGFVVIGGVLVALGTLTIVASRRRGHTSLS